MPLSTEPNVRSARASRRDSHSFAPAAISTISVRIATSTINPVRALAGARTVGSLGGRPDCGATLVCPSGPYCWVPGCMPQR